jgi:hypothetical protein
MNNFVYGSSLYSTLWRHVAWQIFTYISEKSTASFFWVDQWAFSSEILEVWGSTLSNVYSLFNIQSDMYSLDLSVWLYENLSLFKMSHPPTSVNT